MKTWEQIIEDLMKEVQSNGQMGAYFGSEDAGYAYRAASENALVIAKLCKIMAENGLQPPSFLSPEKIQVAENVFVIESVWGWEVIPTPDGYWDKNVWRTLKSTHPTQDDALEAANNLIETLKDVANREKDAASDAQAYVNSAPEATMVSVGFSKSRRSWWDIICGR